MGVIRAIRTAHTGGAAPIANVPQQARCWDASTQLRRAALTVYGAPAAGASVPAHASSPSSHGPLLLQHETHLLELQVLPDDLHLPLLQLLQLLQIDGHLLPHQASAVAAQTLPLPRHPLPLLSVVIQEAAQVPQLLVVLLEFLVHILVYRGTHRVAQ